MLFSSGVQTPIWLPPLVASIISFFTSMGGVSGAFLLLPFQMSFLGFTSPAVSATNQLFNIVAIPPGVYRYLQEGRMVWPLAWVVVLGTLPGVFIGAIVRVVYLPDPKSFKFFVGLVLLYIGVKMIKELLRTGDGMKKSSEQKFEQLVREFRQKKRNLGRDLPIVKVQKFSLNKICYEFYGQKFEFSTLGIFSLSFAVGIIGGVYGIGGGSIVAPFFVSFFRLPVYTIAGASLMGTFVTSIAGVIFYQAIAPFYPHQAVSPDWLLGLLFGLGGMVGMYLGARCQKYVPASWIKAMLSVIIFFTALKYVWGFLRTLGT
ncbi:sulfite exporter TauE/SafE family protein [Desulfohalobiaceae bacterium Ax17]|uniref:sulfite exporter TauE/SafE family protein n=1 Tax=Desulfovulcanus ferrireducens TaxID=2831190 RepID=UPI00207BC397|nr:sulfite exporter TauE/SafE family protein [Desulfovulcanus ferrireducens]MBT8763441.1 sulfite exporter TauE/SafE family protein [Desulfovulcanus ferrireducens]